MHLLVLVELGLHLLHLHLLEAHLLLELDFHGGGLLLQMGGELPNAGVGGGEAGGRGLVLGHAGLKGLGGGVGTGSTRTRPRRSHHLVSIGSGRLGSGGGMLLPIVVGLVVLSASNLFQERVGLVEPRGQDPVGVVDRFPRHTHKGRGVEIGLVVRIGQGLLAHALVLHPLHLEAQVGPTAEEEFCFWRWWELKGCEYTNEQKGIRSRSISPSIYIYIYIYISLRKVGLDSRTCTSR